MQGLDEAPGGAQDVEMNDDTVRPKANADIIFSHFSLCHPDRILPPRSSLAER